MTSVRRGIILIYINARAIIEKIISGEKRYLIQYRTKPGEECFEFPGGRIEKYESIISALRREVKEETGLNVIRINGEDTYIDTCYNDFHVECIKPYAVYQTIRGPVDSMGIYFKCEVEGIPLREGDSTKHIKWVSLKDLSKLLQGGHFSSIDAAALKMLIVENKKEEY